MPVSCPGFTVSVGKTEISVIFFVFGEHRDTNFGPESLWFRFQIQKYESQILVKKNEIRYSENEIVNPGWHCSENRPSFPQELETRWPWSWVSSLPPIKENSYSMPFQIWMESLLAFSAFAKRCFWCAERCAILCVWTINPSWNRNTSPAETVASVPLRGTVWAAASI